MLVSTQSPFEKRGKHGCVFEQREVDRVLGTSLWMYAQICMAMCGGEWVDVVVYAEGGGLVVHSVERDAAFGERVEVYVDRFVKRFVETLCPPGEEEMFEMGDVSYGGDGVFVDADEVERMLQGVRADMDMWYVNRGTHPFN